MRNMGSLLKTRVAIVLAVIIVAGGAAMFGLAHYFRKAPPLATFEVKRGEFLDSMQFRGEIKALKSVIISAPADAGDLQIVKIATDGSQVKQGDVVVEFDPSKSQHDLQQDNSILKSAQAEIEQVRAQGRLTEEDDATAVMKAKYDAEVARLDAGKAEIVSKIEGEEAKLKLADAEQAVREAEAKLKSDQAVDQTSIQDKKDADSKAEYDAQRASHALSLMTLHAPADGTISLISTWHDSGNIAPYKAGDRAWPGAGIAEIPDASSLRITARVDEVERGRLAAGQTATLQFDAIADKQFTGKISHIGTLATTDFSAGWPFPQDFGLEIAVDQPDQRLKPGMSAQITIIVNRVTDAITIPAQASFMKSGQTVAYVWNGSKFEERVIQVEKRSRDRILIASGLHPGDQVALKDPTVKE